MLDDSRTTQILRGRRIAVLIPCLDERETITSVVHDFRRALPEATVYVYDNGSTDGTGAAARMAGAQVREVAARGKGRVVRQMFRDVEADAYVLVDGDDTYDAEAAPELVAHLIEDGLDMVVACRERRPDAYTRARLHGNDLLSELASAALGRAISDLLSGYRVFSHRFVKAFPARSDGFEVETEMTFFAALANLRTAELPTRYGRRPEGSTSKLRTLRDGSRILRTIVRLSLQRHGVRVLGRHLRAATLGAAALTLLFGALLLGLNAAWWRADPAPMLAAIEDSYAFEATSIETSFERFNDCLIPIMATLRRERAIESIVTAERVYRETRPQSPCTALRGLTAVGEIPDDYIRHAYHQYWIGQRVFVQALLPHFTVGGLRRSLLGLTLGLLGVGLIGALWQLRRPPPITAVSRFPTWRTGSYALLFASLLFFYGSIRQGASFTSAWPNALIYGFLVLTLWVPLSRLPTFARLALVTGLGALQAYFALMFGTIGLGLAAVLFAAALDPQPSRLLTLRDERPVGPLSLLLEVSVVYLLAAFGTMAFHLAVAELVYSESVVRGFFDRLWYRVSGDPRTTLAPELQHLFHNEPSLPKMLERMDSRLDLLGFGSTAVGRGLVGLSLVVLLASVVRVARRPGSLPMGDRILGLVLSGAVVPLWFLVFLEHTQTHARVMVRLWAWPIACAGALLLLAELGRRRLKIDESGASAPAETGPSPYL